MTTDNSNSNQDIDKLSQEKLIKHAIIDLLHHNKDVTHSSLSKETGLSLSEVEKHHDSIKSMLGKLKKIQTSPHFKS